jgi:hypothetical protein
MNAIEDRLEPLRDPVTTLTILSMVTGFVFLFIELCVMYR